MKTTYVLRQSDNLVFNIESENLKMPTMGFTRLPQKDAAPVNPSPVIAPSEAWRILQGESPCRERVSHPPVSSLAPVAES